MELAGAVQYEVQGSGEAVLFIHGAIVTDSFAPLMDEPALSGYQLIRYRRRGYGSSAKPSAPATIAEHAADALALLEHLGVRAAHVAGHSGGGPVAVQLAVDAPEVVRSLILLEPVLQSAEMAAAFHELVGAPLIEMHCAGEGSKSVHLWMRRGRSGSEWRTDLDARIPGASDQAVRDAAGTFDPDRGDLVAIRAWDFDAVGAGALDRPVLYIVSAENEANVEPVTSRFLSRVPEAELVVIADADHGLQMVNPGAVAEAMAAFLP
jgi:pimeloyl-ACP methyl ester carboxylesterase